MAWVMEKAKRIVTAAEEMRFPTNLRDGGIPA